MATVHRCERMISLMSAGHDFHRPGLIAAENHLVLHMNDIAFKGTGDLIAPDAHHVDKIIAFARAWDRNTPLLIHCWMGVSRSPAAALIAALAIDPALDDSTLAMALRAASPSATPNQRLIEIADLRLSRGNRLTDAVRAMGRGADCRENTPFLLNFDAGEALKSDTK
ncbi:protein tyrosine phosphatase [Martelella alba]|uniref:Protein tyrosine phosphatase n=1 Tax=Martelella alba TaxID=2590451 RepID=A0A506UJE1_9HYPH|nr:protein tyrosine phosphatase [Martelella alba]TPW33435.1 protein tyrosine phosphatase [Martelella alba]